MPCLLGSCLRWSKGVSFDFFLVLFRDVSDRGAKSQGFRREGAWAFEGEDGRIFFVEEV